jgi:hypothetical protein
MRVHWVAVPKATRARRSNRLRGRPEAEPIRLPPCGGAGGGARAAAAAAVHVPQALSAGAADAVSAVQVRLVIESRWSQFGSECPRL